MNNGGKIISEVFGRMKNFVTHTPPEQPSRPLAKRAKVTKKFLNSYKYARKRKETTGFYALSSLRFHVFLPVLNNT
ncbi:hypothetical protein FACS189432_01800 [Bacteroidia bacterium]|nr:hypothetical protein FACS189432_01800 [Bacteroidia bacterium]